MNLNLLGELVDEMLERNQIDHQPITHGLALAEETGEACRALLKHFQGIRGTADYWLDELEVELAQVVIAVSGLASHMKIDLEYAVAKELDRATHMDWHKERKPT